MKKRVSQWATVTVFCGFLALFGVLHLVLPDRTFSPVENRNLSQFPSFSWRALREGEFTSDIEDYLADQFPLRDGWMGLKTRYEWLLGKREFHDVYLCGDVLISKITDTSRANSNLDYVRRLAEKTEIPVYLGLIPTAAEIWGDKLPAGVSRFDQRTYLDEAKATGAEQVDMYAALDAHKDQRIYYATDHHWTSLGAYYGYTAVAEAMGFEPEPLGEATVASDQFYGTLYSTSGVHWIGPETIERYRDGEGVTVEDVYKEEPHGLYVDSFLGEKDKYASFMGGNAPLYIVRNPDAATDETLLVVRDSYSDSLAPFLADQFAEIHLLDLRYYRTGVAGYAESIGADKILLCYSVENFVKDADAVYIAQ